MAIEFNQEEYIKQLKIHKRLEELQSKYGRELYHSTHDNTGDIKNHIEECENKIKKLNSFFKRRKNKDEIELLTKTLDNHKTHLKELIKEANERKENVRKMKEEIDMLKSQKKDILISDAIIYDNDELIIIDDAEVPLNDNASNDKFMVHCTDFFPKNNTILCDYDGNKKGIVDFEYNGNNKKVERVSHRHTVHFTINSIVKTTGATRMAGGIWEQPKFIIIEPLDEHKQQFISGLDGYSDEFTYGSVKLGKKPILLVREDSYNEIPKDEVDNYNIVKYRGNYKKCFNNFILSLGYKLTYGDPNTAEHHYSDVGRIEELLDKRHDMINYVLNNKYDGKSDINLSIDNIDKLFNIYNYKSKEKEIINIMPSSLVYNRISELTNIPLEFVKFCFDLGIYKSDDFYKIDNDDKMYESRRYYRSLINKFSTIRDDRENSISIATSTNYGRIEQIYIDYLKYQKEQLNNKTENEIQEQQTNIRHM